MDSITIQITKNIKKILNRFLNVSYHCIMSPLFVNYKQILCCIREITKRMFSFINDCTLSFSDVNYFRQTFVSDKVTGNTDGDD